MNDGGPAFPQSLVDNQGRIDKSYDFCDAGGMSLRDYFAAAALSSLPNELRHTHGGTELAVKSVAQWAFRVADAMISERAKEAAE